MCEGERERDNSSHSLTCLVLRVDFRVGGREGGREGGQRAAMRPQVYGPLPPADIIISACLYDGH